MSVGIIWDKGGEGRILALSTDSVRLSSTIPSPPGSRLDGSLSLDPAAKVRFKIHVCKRVENGEGFMLEGRPLDMLATLRERIVQSIADAPGTT